MEQEKFAWVRTFRGDFGLIVAACDYELLNKRLRRGDVEIELSSHFFGERVVSRWELESILLEADSLNLFGEKVVSLAEELGLINPLAKIFFEAEDGRKVPHAQMYRFML